MFKMKKIVRKMRRAVCIMMSFCVLFTLMSAEALAYQMSGEGTDDYTTWKQTSSSWGEATPWPNASIPKFGDAGCWITSVAILLRHYNVVADSNVNTFNPLICNNRLMEFGIVDSAGDWCNLSQMGLAYPGFEYAGTMEYSFGNLKSLYDQGYACIVHETKGHYVAVRTVTDSDAVVMDPGSSITYLTDSDSIQYYSVSSGNSGASVPTASFYDSSLEINPEGCLDAVTGGDGTITVKGWAFDRNSDEPLEIHVYIGGPYNSAVWGTDQVKADRFRADVNAVYPGAGEYHGFEETISVPMTGTYDVYVYAINVGKRSGDAYNPLLGHGTVTINDAGQAATPVLM